VQGNSPPGGVAINFVGALLHEGTGVPGEAAAGRLKQPAVPRCFREQRLHQFQAEGYGFADRVGIVMGGENGSARFPLLTINVYIR
jgi:hypothetical protein